MKKAFYYPMDIGLVEIVEEEGAIISVDIGASGKKYLHLEETPLIKETHQQLDDYFMKKRKVFQFPIRLFGTPFQQKVWNELLFIPYGKTCTYHDIACKIGNPRANRAVGRAIHFNPIAIIVPCHRVIGMNSKLVGYAKGLSVKKLLLELEQFNG